MQKNRGCGHSRIACRLANTLELTNISFTLCTLDRSVQRVLEHEGFVTSQIGIGTFVSASNIDLLRDSKRRVVEQKMQDMIQTAKSLNITKEELNAMMDILYEGD